MPPEASLFGYFVCPYLAISEVISLFGQEVHHALGGLPHCMYITFVMIALCYFVVN